MAMIQHSSEEMSTLAQLIPVIRADHSFEQELMQIPVFPTPPQLGKAGSAVQHLLQNLTQS